MARATSNSRLGEKKVKQSNSKFNRHSSNQYVYGARLICAIAAPVLICTDLCNGRGEGIEEVPRVGGAQLRIMDSKER